MLESKARSLPDSTTVVEAILHQGGWDLIINSREKLTSDFAFLKKYRFLTSVLFVSGPFRNFWKKDVKIKMTSVWWRKLVSGLILGARAHNITSRRKDRNLSYHTHEHQYFRFRHIFSLSTYLCVSSNEKLWILKSRLTSYYLYTPNQTRERRNE